MALAWVRQTRVPILGLLLSSNVTLGQLSNSLNRFFTIKYPLGASLLVSGTQKLLENGCSSPPCLEAHSINHA